MTFLENVLYNVVEPALEIGVLTHLRNVRAKRKALEIQTQMELDEELERLQCYMRNGIEDKNNFPIEFYGK